MTRKRSRHTDSREFFNETHEPNSPPSNKKTRGKQTSTQHQSHQPPPVTQPLSIEHRLVEKRKRVKIQPKNLSQERYLQELNNPKKQIVFAIGPAGTGKAQPLTAKIKIPGGWTTMGDIKVGDLVSTPDGLSAAVTGIFPQGIKQTYSVTLYDGRTTTFALIICGKCSSEINLRLLIQCNYTHSDTTDPPCRTSACLNMK